MHGMLRDISGEKMSKSLGNIISPDEMVQKHGADVLRYYMCQTNAGQDIRFSWEGAALKGRYLQILWNVHKLLLNLTRENMPAKNPPGASLKPAHLNPFNIKINKKTDLQLEEKYILSLLHSTIQEVTTLFEAYRIDETIAPLEKLYLELSRTYIQMVRDKSSIGSQKEKEVCMNTIATVLFDCLRMFQVIAPFISETIYLNLRDEFGLPEKSINLYSWPDADKTLINPVLEQQMSIVFELIASTLAARERAQLGLRWPIKEVIIESSNSDVEKAVEALQDIFLSQTNAKSVQVMAAVPEVEVMLKPDFSKINPVFKQRSAEIVAQLALTSPQTILSHFQREGKYTLSMGEQQANITKEMMIVERRLPELYQVSEGKYGVVYINTERTNDLVAEGYAREVMRHIQTLRKTAGLEKKDRIKLVVDATPLLRKAIEQFSAEIREKVGADKLELKKVDASVEVVKIKGETLKVSF